MTDTRLTALVQALEGIADTPDYYTESGINQLSDLLGEADASCIDYAKGVRHLRRMCRATGLVPASCTIAQDIVNLSEEPIARTAFSDVWTRALSGRQVAVKALRVHGIQVQAAKKAYLHELVVWKCLRHPNIVPFIGVSLLFEVSLVSEWMSGGTLSSFISQYPDHDRSALVNDIIDGLSFMHSLDVVHGDLKPDNVLVDSQFRARFRSGYHDLRYCDCNDYRSWCRHHPLHGPRAFRMG